MKEQSVFSVLKMSMLPVSERTLVFEDELMLTDNLELISEAWKEVPLIADAYPFKIDFTMVLFCQTGYSRGRINLKEFRLETNDVLVAPPGSIGEYIEFGKDCRMVAIADAGANFFNDDIYSQSVFFCKYLAEQAVIHLTPEEMQEIVEIYHRMRQKVEQTDFKYTRVALQGYIQVLASIGYQWGARYHDHYELEKKTETHQQKIFNTFMELAQRHFKKERTIGFYADKMCLTPKYLSQVIRRVSGRYAGEWIDDYVILEAKALLRSKKYTVAQVCDILGFANASHFCKHFKAAVGCSPGKYMLT